jgi:hypothetical protein
MRNRVRIQPYVAPDLRRRLAGYSRAQDVTESAVVEAALIKYLEPEGTDQALVVRRLDAVVQTLARIEGGLEIVGDTVGRLVRFLYSIAPAKVAPDETRHGEERYRTLIATVSRAVGTSTGFLATVRRARLFPAAAPSSPVPGRAVGGGTP